MQWTARKLAYRAGVVSWLAAVRATFAAGVNAIFPGMVGAMQEEKADVTLRIAPVSFEIAPGKTIHYLWL
jgi:hypothetical protein